MADIEVAVQFVLKQEDAEMTGVITNTQNDRGGRTRWGVAEHAHPELLFTGFYDSMDRDTSLAKAISIYEHDYAMPLSLDHFQSQSIANALLSFGINEGLTPAVKVLQTAIDACSSGLVVDGVIGPATIAAANELDQPTLLQQLGSAQKAHYAAIVAANPSQASFIHGWNNRVAKTMATA